MKFRKGQTVRRVLSGAGVVTEEAAVVLRVSGGKVWLDNGLGNSPLGPFNSETGRREGFGLLNDRIEHDAPPSR